MIANSCPRQNPLITNGGLLFTSGGYEVNIFSTGPSLYTYYDNSGYNTPVSFSLSEAVSSQSVPEPSTLILVGIASLMGLGLRMAPSLQGGRCLIVYNDQLNHAGSRCLSGSFRLI